MTARRIIYLEAQLRKARAKIAVLEARQSRGAIDSIAVPDWSWALTRQELALVQALREAYPRAMTDEALNEAIPHHDHAAIRSPTLIPAVVSRARRKIPGNIERVPGVGYRLSREAAARL